jgi:hypothetical protein
LPTRPRGVRSWATFFTKKERVDTLQNWGFCRSSAGRDRIRSTKPTHGHFSRAYEKRSMVCLSPLRRQEVYNVALAAFRPLLQQKTILRVPLEHVVVEKHWQESSPNPSRHSHFVRRRRVFFGGERGRPMIDWDFRQPRIQYISRALDREALPFLSRARQKSTAMHIYQRVLAPTENRHCRGSGKGIRTAFL